MNERLQWSMSSSAGRRYSPKHISDDDPNLHNAGNRADRYLRVGTGRLVAEVTYVAGGWNAFAAYRKIDNVPRTVTFLDLPDALDHARMIGEDWAERQIGRLHDE